MSLHANILECTLFLGKFTGMDASGTRPTMKIGATGFLLSFPSKVNPTWIHQFLVTARHVAEKTVASGCAVRFNLKAGGSDMVLIPDPDWHFPADRSVDLALHRMAIAPDMKAWCFPLEYLLTDEIREAGGFGPGDTVVVTGMLAEIGERRSVLPVTRVGSVALMPDEPIRSGRMHEDGTYMDAELYLIELVATGGLSGSPVFLTEPSNPFTHKDSPYKPAMLLFGVFHGHYSAPTAQGSMENAGIAMVVPAKKLRELIESPSVQANVARFDQEWANRPSTAADNR